MAANDVSGAGLSVYDAEDRRVYLHMFGTFSADQRVAVASASKLVASFLLLQLVGEEKLSLDDTTGSVLGWSTNDDITLRQLLSFTSGLPRESDCTASLTMTLAECVDEIAESTPVAAPGTRYDYGSTHLHVAARMAETVSGKAWNELFRTVIASPLGLPAEVQFYTAPRKGLGTQNPLVAGGLRASMNEYAALLAIAFHRGSFADLTIGTPQLFDEQAREPYPDVTIGYSPIAAIGQPFRYGLCAWLECDTPEAGCDVLSSPGAFGFTPWFDRTHGYYAVLGMELPGSGGGPEFSVPLEQALKPAIVQALAK